MYGQASGTPANPSDFADLIYQVTCEGSETLSRHCSREAMALLEGFTVAGRRIVLGLTG